MIDLKQNNLVIGTTNTKTKFLAESELPSHGRLHDPNAQTPDELTSQTSSPNTSENKPSSSVSFKLAMSLKSDIDLSWGRV